MTPRPLLSIVVPVSNDEATVANAIRSSLAQGMSEIEILCVDDGSTDRTLDVLKAFAQADARVRVIQHPRNLSAFQARRSGVFAAAADYTLFLDGDDELTPKSVSAALDRAKATRADIIGFGVTVVERDGTTGGSYEARLQPPRESAVGTDVLRSLFPIGAPAQGQLWRFLFATSLLRKAYDLVPESLSLMRVNDLPLLFLAAALAESYTAIPDKIYRYHFGRGASGHRVDTMDRARFYVSAIDSVTAVRPAVEVLCASFAEATLLRETYDSVRLSIVGYVCYQLTENGTADVLEEAITHLHSVATPRDVLRAITLFYPSTLRTFKHYAGWEGLPVNGVRSVLLASSTIRTGGVSAVLASQVHYLTEAGYQVTVVARDAGSDRTVLPPETAFFELTSRQLPAQLSEWAAICRDQRVDLVIDHQLLYMDTWPEFALAARSEGASTIGWLHNFVGRPVYDGNNRLALLERHSALLAQLIVLSQLDVAYFKLRGVEHVAFLPNPPSPLMLESLKHAPQKQSPSRQLNLVWWGRLEQRTKQVRELVEVGVRLRAQGVPFMLTIVGPGWDDMTVRKLNAFARKRHIAEHVVAIGPLRGRDLTDAIDSAHAFVSTSIIEGYQLTIAEAQSRGLPVFMYELPWLSLTQDNAGIVSVPQGDADALANALARVFASPAAYQELSSASRVASRKTAEDEFSRIYEQLVSGSLPERFSPSPTLADAGQLLGLLTNFAYRGRSGTAMPSPNGSSWLGHALRAAAPAGKAVLRRLPALRPLAYRLKALVKSS